MSLDFLCNSWRFYAKSLFFSFRYRCFMFLIFLFIYLLPHGHALTSQYRLNQCGKWQHSCLTYGVRWKLFSLLPLNMIQVVGFPWLSFIRASLFYSWFACVLWWVFLFCFYHGRVIDIFKPFSASNKRITRTGNLLYQFSFPKICEKWFSKKFTK